MNLAKIYILRVLMHINSLRVEKLKKQDKGA